MGKRDRAAVEQLLQPARCPLAKLALGSAARLVRLRRVDFGNPYLYALKPAAFAERGVISQSVAIRIRIAARVIIRAAVQSLCRGTFV